MQELQLQSCTVPPSPEYRHRPGNAQSDIEQRAQARTLVQGEAEILLHDSTRALHGRILNLTPSGCFIQILELVCLLPCTHVDVQFLVNGSVVQIASEVRFSTPQAGVGFRFLDSGSAMQTILDTVQNHRTDLASTGTPATRPAAAARI
jgi:hypothetical protein